MEKQEAIKRREEMVQEALEQSTPVPESFEQAVTWATMAALTAAQAGRMRQSMYFDTGAGDGEVGGDLGGCLAFVEVMAKTMAESDQLEGGTVRVLFTDMGAAAMSANKWEPMPETLKVDYFPPVIRGKSELNPDEKYKLQQILESEVIIAACPSQAELPAMLQLLKLMGELGRDVPLILVNAKLVTNAYVAAGTMLKDCRGFERTLVPTFHLEQIEPEDDELNPCVVTRVWPRPFSTWEDNPEDPDAIDGFFLMDLNEQKAPEGDAIRSMLQASKDVAKKLRERGLLGAGGR